MLELLQSEILVRRTALPMAALLCSQQGSGAGPRFFAALYERMEQAPGQDFAALFRGVLQEGRWDLLQEDRALLEELGPVLGRYDGAVQADAIAACRGRLLQNADRAREEQERKGRISRAAGASFGIALALLVI